MKSILIGLIAFFLIFNSVNSSLTCDACSFIAQAAEDAFANNKTATGILAHIEILCNALPGAIAEECDTLITEYGSLVINMIVNNESPDQICTSLKLCSSNNMKNKIRIHKEQTSGLDCSVCEWVAQKVEGYIEGNASQTQILAFLDKECNYLTISSWINTCETLVNNYAPVVIGSITQKESPEVVCSQIDLCSGSSSSQAEEKLPSGCLGDGECGMCTYVSGEVVALVTNNATFDDVQTFVDNLCAKLPDSFANLCSTFANTYLSDVYTFAKDNSPEQICQKFGLCQNSSSEAVAQEKKEELSGDNCSLCEYVAGIVDNYVTNNATFDEVETFVDNQCAKLPGGLGDLCTTFANTYLADVYTLAKDYTPEQICEKLKFCSGSSDASQAEELVMTEEDNCSLCQYVAGVVVNYVSNNATFDDVEAFVDKECAKLPGGLGDLCTTFANTYLADVYTLAKDSTPEEICEKIKLCSGSSDESAPAVFEAEGSYEPTIGCELCLTLYPIAEELLSNNQTDQQTLQELLQECQNLKYPIFINGCTIYVNMEGQKIINFIINNKNSSSGCYDLGMCYNNTDSTGSFSSGSSSGSGSSSSGGSSSGSSSSSGGSSSGSSSSSSGSSGSTSGNDGVTSAPPPTGTGSSSNEPHSSTTHHAFLPKRNRLF